MMNKTDKLYLRLTGSEKEFKELLIQELGVMSKSGYSSYLHDRSRNYYVGKKTRSSNAVLMDKLEDEIILLREKIIGSSDNSIIHLMAALDRIFGNSYKFPEGYLKSVTNILSDQLKKVDNDDYSSIINNLNDISIPDNFKPDDFIVKAKKNLHFPMPFKDIVCLMNEFNIRNKEGNRLAIELSNPENTHIEGFVILQLIPWRKIIINSHPSQFNEILSRKLLRMAISQINPNISHLNYKSGAYISMIFRISNNITQLDCLKREVKYKEAKYRSGDKFSNSGKPHGKTVDEKLIASIVLNA